MGRKAKYFPLQVTNWEANNLHETEIFRTFATLFQYIEYIENE